MDLAHVRAFLAAADALHFTRAAATLGIAQPTLSLQIRQLEADVGVPLFDRVGRGVRLTAAGEELRVRARTALGLLESARDAMADLAGARAGTLRVGATHILATWLLPDVIARFHKAYSGVKLVIEKLTSRQVEQRLLAGNLELGVTFSPPRAPEALAQSLFTERVVVALPAGHPLARRRSLDLARLATVPLLLTTPDFATRRLLEEAAERRGVRLQVAMELNDIDLLLALVRAGAGATVLAKRALGKSPRVALVPLANPALAHTATLVWHRDRYRTAAARAFAALLEAAAADLRESR